MSNAAAATGTPPYMVQLDALRAFAVTAVLIHHYKPGGWNYGAYSGVKLFFTISGFLITGILLRARDDAEAQGHSRIGAMGRFYARRFLRIFPLYYFVIAVACIVNLEPARRLIGWLLTYTLNVHMASQGWFEANFAHFWSLSVEEQFYIFWPWIVLFVPRRWLKVATVLTILVGPMFRLSYILSGYTNVTALAVYISTLSSLDHLGFGALLAMLVHRQPRERFLGRWLYVLLAVSLLSVVLVVTFYQVNIYLLLHDSTQAVLFSCLIYLASVRFGGFAGRLMERKPILYVGKISYGLYVYHPLMPRLAQFILLHLTGVSVAEKTWLISGAAVVLSLGIASLSWQLMERPINDLKRHFSDLRQPGEPRLAIQERSPRRPPIRNDCHETARGLGKPYQLFAATNGRI
jgi:peptidoglycan/LPS O-acetylase OafA/YrhL